MGGGVERSKRRRRRHLLGFESGDMIGPATDQFAEPLLIKLAWHAASVISIKRGAVDAGGAGSGEVSQRRDALRPVAAACPP
jgi:hypothetical protein